MSGGLRAGLHIVDSEIEVALVPKQHALAQLDRPHRAGDLEVLDGQARVARRLRLLEHALFDHADVEVGRGHGRRLILCLFACLPA